VTQSMLISTQQRCYSSYLATSQNQKKFYL